MVDFSADWCGPCKMAEPIIEKIAENYQDKVVFVKINVDENHDIAAKFQVMSIPTTILFKNGKEVDRTIGFSGPAAFEALIKKGL